jgi:exosortase
MQKDQDIPQRPDVAVTKSSVNGWTLLAGLSARSAPAAVETNRLSRRLCMLGSKVAQAVRTHHRLILLLTLLMVLYWHVITGLVRQWSVDPDFSYGFVIPFFSGYLIWRLRPVLDTIRPHPAGAGLLTVLIAILMLIAGNLAAELFFTRISLVLITIGLVHYFAGWESVRTLAFPLGYLGVMVPPPAILYNHIVLPLQLLSTLLAAYALQATRIVPVLREGNLLILPNYTLAVVEACSGIRSVMCLLALALGYGYLARDSLWRRIALAAAMFPIAVAGNCFRIVVAAFITQFWNPRAAEGFLHSFSGILIFLFAVFALLFIHRGLLNMPRPQVSEQ